MPINIASRFQSPIFFCWFIQILCLVIHSCVKYLLTSFSAQWSKKRRSFGNFFLFSNNSNYSSISWLVGTCFLRFDRMSTWAVLLPRIEVSIWLTDIFTRFSVGFWNLAKSKISSNPITINNKQSQNIKFVSSHEIKSPHSDRQFANPWKWVLTHSRISKLSTFTKSRPVVKISCYDFEVNWKDSALSKKDQGQINFYFDIRAACSHELQIF